METTHKKYTGLKIALAFLPALVFTQNYAWMTLNSYNMIALLIIWSLMIWSVYQFTEKNHILERTFRLMEVAFFLFPLSAIIGSFMFGAKAVTGADNGAAQAGAAIGSAIGGVFMVGLAFVLGITGGIIMRVIAGKYEKKADATDNKQSEHASNKHGIIVPISAIFLLAIVLGSVSSSRETSRIAREKETIKNSLQQGGVVQADAPATAQQEKVGVEIIKKGFQDIDVMARIYEAQVSMNLKFTNRTDKDIRGVEGTLTTYDIFGNKIKSINISYDKGIPKNGSKVWESGVEYNQFSNEDVKLKDTDLQDLKYKWEVSTIVYADGTTEN